jgi:hypothetical protein
MEDGLTGSELVFLALGIGLGVVAGGALLMGIRSRPPTPPIVRVTVERDAIPRRASTLSTMLIPAPNAPAPMGPADRRTYARVAVDDGSHDGWELAAATRDERRDGTSVRNGLAPATPTTFVLPARYGMVPRRTSVEVPIAMSDRELVAIPIEPEGDPTLAALGRPAPRAEADARSGALVTATAVAVSAAAAADRPAGSASGDPVADAPPGTGDGDGPCADQRRLTDERCAVAARASEEATRAADELHAARRSYDDHLTRAEGAAADADPRAARAAKDAAQHAYRVARSGALSAAEQEAAAAAWLDEINRINAATKEATSTATRERDAAAALVLAIERLTVQADAARISAEAAQEICVQARETLAACEEQAIATGGDGRGSEPPSTRDDELGLPDEESALVSATATGPAPRIVRLLRGERPALIAVVDALAGADPGQRRHWQLLVTDLADAIVARAIEESMLDFPDDHPFWGSFSKPQCRDIVAALASLGYRFDGLGGYADARVPTQRDLSLALGYAGLDPMRIRVWPTEPETAALFADVRVAADEYLAGAGGDLTLVEMIDLLGRRADALADLWNNWGRARPALLIVE